METAEMGMRFLWWWFVLSIPLALWAGWTLRRHAPRDLDKELAPPGADVLQLNNWGRR